MAQAAYGGSLQRLDCVMLVEIIFRWKCGAFGVGEEEVWLWVEELGFRWLDVRLWSLKKGKLLLGSALYIAKDEGLISLAMVKVLEVMGFY